MVLHASGKCSCMMHLSMESVWCRLWPSVVPEVSGQTKCAEAGSSQDWHSAGGGRNFTHLPRQSRSTVGPALTHLNDAEMQCQVVAKLSVSLQQSHVPRHTKTEAGLVLRRYLSPIHCRDFEGRKACSFLPTSRLLGLCCAG